VQRLTGFTDKAQTTLLPFVVDLLYRELYNKSKQWSLGRKLIRALYRLFTGCGDTSLAAETVHNSDN